MGSYAQKRVMIAGGSPEMRKIYIDKLLKENATVIVLGDKLMYNQTKNNGTEDTHVQFAYCDFSNKRSVDQAIHEVINRIGKVDVLINHLEMQKSGDILDISENDWKNGILERLRAMFFLNQSVIRTMVDRDRPGAVISAVYTEKTAEDSIGYHIVAESIRQIVRQMADEVKEYGIRVSGLGLGGISEKAALQEIVSQILFLGSEEAESVSGTFLS